MQLIIFLLAELRVHFEPTIWREYSAPAKEHPMSQVIFDVKAAFEKIGSKTKVMPASIVTPREVNRFNFISKILKKKKIEDVRRKIT